MSPPRVTIHDDPHPFAKGVAYWTLISNRIFDLDVHNSIIHTGVQRYMVLAVDSRFVMRRSLVVSIF